MGGGGEGGCLGAGPIGVVTGKPATLHQGRQHQRAAEQPRSPDHAQQLLPSVAEPRPEAEHEEAAAGRGLSGGAAATAAEVRDVLPARVAYGARAGGGGLL